MSLTLESLREVWNKEFLLKIRREIREEFDSLNASVRNLNRRFNELEKVQNFISTKYDSVMEAIQHLKKQNQSVENQIPMIAENVSALNNSGYDVEVKLDELEQYGRRNCLEITGIPMVPDDNPVLLVQEMSAIMGVGQERYFDGTPFTTNKESEGWTYCEVYSTRQKGGNLFQKKTTKIEET